MTSRSDWSRRDFVRYSTATALAATVAPQLGGAAEPKEPLPTAAQFITGKDARLLVHSAKTGEIETPLELLREHAITPKEILFVRNNQVFPDTLTLAPAQAPDWQVELKGLVEVARSVTVEQLTKLPQHDVEMVLQCSGNSRTQFEKSVKAEGVPWRHGAMGNVVFRGVRLRDVLEQTGAKVSAQARFVAVEGKDLPPKAGAADFEHSVPLDEALDRAILALGMNGEPLPKAHGGPVRFILPGYYATVQVKWLGTLRFEERESANYHHVERYRTPRKPIAPGTPFTSTLDNSDANWNMRIKSVIFGPIGGSSVPSGKVVVHGVAWNDGQVKIEAVEVSADGGQTWIRSELTRPKSPYAWHPWRVELPLAAGKQTVISRAIDVRGQAQPLDGSVGWCPAGYCWNGVDTVTFQVS